MNCTTEENSNSRVYWCVAVWSKRVAIRSASSRRSHTPRAMTQMGRSWTKGAHTLSNNIVVTSSTLRLVLYEATMYKKQPDVERPGRKALSTRWCRVVASLVWR